MVLWEEEFWEIYLPTLKPKPRIRLEITMILTRVRVQGLGAPDFSFQLPSWGFVKHDDLLSLVGFPITNHVKW